MKRKTLLLLLLLALGAPWAAWGQETTEAKATYSGDRVAIEDYDDRSNRACDISEDFSGVTPIVQNTSSSNLPNGWAAMNVGSGNFPTVTSDGTLGTNYLAFSTNENYLYLVSPAGSSSTYNGSIVVLPCYRIITNFSFSYQFEHTSSGTTFGTFVVGYATSQSFTSIGDITVLETVTNSSTLTTFSLSSSSIQTLNNNNGYLVLWYYGNNNTSYEYGIGVNNICIGLGSTTMTCGQSYSGTVGNSYNAWSSYSNTGASWPENGEEHIYSYTPPVTSSYTFTCGNVSNDPDFFLLDTPNPTGNGIGYTSNGDITATLTGGITYYLIVDNYSSSSSNYTVSVSCPSFSITAWDNPTGAGTISGAGTYDYGTSCTLTATAASGYTFDYWIKNGTETIDTNPYTFTVTADADFQAHFTEVYLISDASDITTCSGTIYDSGGPNGNYSNSEDYTKTIYPGTPGMAVKLEFTIFETESVSYDYIEIYDGTSTNATLIGKYGGTNSPGIVAASNPTGALTLKWHSDSSVNKAGFAAIISCGEPTPVVTISNVTANSATASWTGASSSYTVRYGAANPYIDFETGDMSQASFTYSGGNWTTSTTSPYNGSYCAKSGNAGTSSSTSYMEISVTLSSTGLVSFAGKVSSETCCDHGYFYIDGTQQVQVADDAAWHTYSYELTAGTHTLRWAYTKDGSVNSGDDCFYVDDIMVADLVNTATTSSTSYNMTGLTMGTWYMATVQGANSDMSDPVVFQTPSTHTLTASVNPANSGTISANGTTISGATTYNHGTSVTLTPTPATGYDFVNWTVDGTTQTGNTYTVTMDQDHTVVANFQLQSFTVTVLAEEGGTATGGGNYNYGATATLTATPDECYDFSQWIDENGGIHAGFNPIEITVDHDITMTAQFTIKTYIISVSAGVGGNASGSNTYDCGESCTVTAEPAAGYTFDGWYESNSRVSTSTSYTFTVTAARTLEARFTQDTYSVSVSANPAAGGTVNGGGNTFTYGASCTVTAAANPGYTFTGWFEDNTRVSTSTSYTFTVTAAHTLEARFTQDTYSVSVSASPAAGGTVSGGGNTFTYGASCTVTATANPGYTFGGWYEDNSLVSSNANYTFTVTAAHTLEARFGADQTLTTYANPIEGGYVTIAPVSNIGCDTIGTTYTSATAVGASTTPFSTQQNYSYQQCLYLASEIASAGWITSISYEVFGNQQAQNDHIEVFMKNTTRTNAFGTGISSLEPITASDKVFDGTWNIPANGWATIVLDRPFYYDGTSSLVIGIHENSPGYTATSFVKTDCPSNFRFTCYSMTEDMDPLNLSGTSFSTGRGKDRANVRLGFGTYHYGQSVTLTAHANEGYQFVNWTENDVELGTNDTYTVTMDADHAIYANFERLAKRFVTAGNWNVDNNWRPTGAPDITDDVFIEAAATIPNGVVATANEITVTTGSITIQDGGQLVHNNAASSMVTVTAQNTITRYTSADANTNKGYELVSFPVDNLTVNSSAITGLVTSDPYDFYRFDASNDPLEWIPMTGNNSISLLQGFIYASQEGTTISVTGPVMSSATPVNSASVAYVTANAPRFNGWALLGNPFVCNAYVSLGTGNGAGSETNFYKLNHTATYDEFVPFTNSDAVNPMGGVMFRVFNNDNIVYSRAEISGAKTGILNMDVTCVKDRATVTLDRARVRFGEGRNLEKLQFDTRHTKVYIPEGGNDFSVYYADGAGTIPVNFKAQDNGHYTLDFSTEDVGFNYLHLIDNMNGNDVDLLQTPYYAFDAKSTDFASRFTLVFATGNDNDDTFAFFNNGVWIINNDGEATLQVVDALGRMLSSENISGSTSKAINVAPGVYMLRLINGDKVKVQKIVVKR